MCTPYFIKELILCVCTLLIPYFHTTFTYIYICTEHGVVVSLDPSVRSIVRPPERSNYNAVGTLYTVRWGDVCITP